MNSVQNWGQKVNEAGRDYEADAYPKLIYHKIKPSQMEKAELILHSLAVVMDIPNLRPHQHRQS